MELDAVINTKDFNRLKEIYNLLIEEYVRVNREDVIVSCFVNLRTEGIYSNNKEQFIKLSKQASIALDNHNYDELLKIVNKLYEIDERGFYEK